MQKRIESEEKFEQEDNKNKTTCNDWEKKEKTKKKKRTAFLPSRKESF